MPERLRWLRRYLLGPAPRLDDGERVVAVSQHHPWAVSCIGVLLVATNCRIMVLRGDLTGRTHTDIYYNRLVGIDVIECFSGKLLSYATLVIKEHGRDPLVFPWIQTESCHEIRAAAGATVGRLYGAVLRSSE